MAHRVRRAPPLESLLRAPRAPALANERERAIAAFGRTVGAIFGTVWAIGLLLLLSWLNRVPALEALLWSTLSGAITGRTVHAIVQGWMRRWFGELRLELGPPDAPSLRKRVPRIARRYGYTLQHHALHGDRFVPRFGRTLLPVLRVHWSGPGAVVEGPRMVVRAIAAASAL